MKSKLPDPDGYSPNDIIERLHRCIDSGTYGIDYTIDARPKNESFYERYIISEKERIDVLRKLSVDHYDGWDYSDNPEFPKDIVHFFHFPISLFPRGIEDAACQKIRLYIKLTWTKYMDRTLIIISFHD